MIGYPKTAFLDGDGLGHGCDPLEHETGRITGSLRETAQVFGADLIDALAVTDPQRGLALDQTFGNGDGRYQVVERGQAAMGLFKPPIR
jgi:hypothetical protein